MIQAEKETSFRWFFKEYRSEIKFVLIFCVGIIVGFKVIYTDVVSNNIIYPVTVAEAYVASKVLNAIGFPNKQDGVNISGTSKKFWSMRVQNNCNGVYESIVFLMAFIAIQIPWRRKLGWMAIGFTLFHLVNELRLISLFIIGNLYSNDTFVFFHETFWNYALIIVTLGIFLFCAHKVSQNAAPITTKPEEAEA